jgi:XisI protein
MVAQALNARSLSTEIRESSADEPRLHTYRRVITTLLTDYAARSSTPLFQCITILDSQQDHYQALDIGWDEDGRRIFQPVIHIDILNDKIWIQENVTDLDLDTLFSAEGIHSSEIVLGLHSPSLRKLGIYAIE